MSVKDSTFLQFRKEASSGVQGGSRHLIFLHIFIQQIFVDSFYEQGGIGRV